MNHSSVAGAMPKRISFRGFIEKRKNTIVEIIAALFILLFLYTALSKSFQISSTVNVLKKTPGFSAIAEVTAWGVVITEYIIAALLFIPRFRKTGLIASLVLMLAFTGYIGLMKAFVPNLPCSCGGVISKMSWNQHLVFNIVFSLLALTGILLLRKKKQNPGTETHRIVYT